MTDRIQEYFDHDAQRLAELYDQKSWFAKNVDRRLRSALFDYVDFIVSMKSDWTKTTVIDVGCGVGALAVELARRGAKVTAIDISPQMIERTRERARAAGVAGRMRCIEGDIAAMDLDETFDLVVAIGVAEYVADPLSFLSNLRDLSCGLLAATFVSDNSAWGRFRMWRYRRHGISIHFYSEDEVRGLIDKTGIRVVQLAGLAGGKGWFLTAEPAVAYSDGL